MRVLVTGGAGFIGSHIAEALVERGNEVAVLDDLSSGQRSSVPAQARFYEGDVCDPRLVDRVFQEFRPRFVSHQAGQVSVAVSVREPLLDARINVLGSLTLLEASRRSGAERFVFASTGGAIYGDVPDGQRAAVDWPPKPVSPYAASKNAVEVYLEAFGRSGGPDYRILRYSNVYGPRQDPHGEAGVVAIFCQRLLNGEPVVINARRERGDEGCVRDYVYVEDVVQANLLALDGRIETPILNVATGQATSTQELAQQLLKSLAGPSSIDFAPPRPGDIEVSVLDPGPFPVLLGRPPMLLEAGLSRTLEWFRGGSAGDGRSAECVLP